MDIKEAAEYLHIKVWTLYRLAKRGKVPAIKVGGQWRFKRDVLDAMFHNDLEFHRGGEKKSLEEEL